MTTSSALHTAEQLRSQVKGTIAVAGMPEYERARTVWNAMIDRRPAVVVRCTSADDVRNAIAFARDHSLELSVRGGGHNIAGTAVCDNGVMLDLTPMTTIVVDAGNRRASVQPGATLREMDSATQAFALATPLGINSTTGVAGLTLGGGFGWLTRRHGMTIDNLLAAEVVTADGRTLRASEDENQDLFWAIRGGGGNFGVVTNFEFALHPVGPDVLAGLIVYPFEQAADVLNQYRQLATALPEELSVWVVLRQAPPLPFLPADVHGKAVVVLALCYAGPVAEGESLVEPLRRLGNPHGAHVGPVPYAAWQQAFDPLLTPGARNYWKSHNFTELPDGALSEMIGFAGRLPSPQCEIFVGCVAGAANRVAADATAYAARDARYVMNVHGRWDAPADDGACIAWARAFFKASAPYASGGAYVNFMTGDESARVAAAYGPNYARLVEIKRRYDPDNVFHMNQNIAP